MSNKTVWVAGGLILAVSAVAYLSYHDNPAGKDAAGTIVEAKRAHADGSGGASPSGTTGTTNDSSGGPADRSGADGTGADRGGADRGGADRGGADRGGADRGGADRGGADRGGADRGGA